MNCCIQLNTHTLICTIEGQLLSIQRSTILQSDQKNGKNDSDFKKYDLVHFTAKIIEYRRVYHSNYNKLLYVFLIYITDLCGLAGLYIHIPYCRKACTYCNFHFSTSFKNVDHLIHAMSLELAQRAHELTNQSVETIYFGGGTPSVLSETQLSAIIRAIQTNYNVNELLEFTLEANPEDINSENLEFWRKLGVNRLSIGLQSLNDLELQKMNRMHTANQSKLAVERALKSGFDKITIDLIYGTPWKSDQEFEAELEWALNSGINHLSAYALTIEPKTLLSHLVNKEEITPSSDEKVESQFFILQNKIKEFGWDAYEISNYCKPNHQAIHNSNYWEGKDYLGIGPAAHSYNGNQRRWNIANNALYISSIENAIPYFELEDLSAENQANEYIMTQLRTKKGIDISYILKSYPNWQLNNKIKMEELILNGYATMNSGNFKLTDSGKLISDYIISELMI